jgi:uncharacterized protein (DUF1697 family)
MTRYVALWRGINVGKAKRLAMADLKLLLAGMGAQNVVTLLNSGNAVFDADAFSATELRDAVAQHLGVDAAVILKTAAELSAIAGQQPIAEADDPRRLLVSFTDGILPLAGLQELICAPPDRLVITAHAAYLWCAGGILESKTGTQLLKRLGERGTTRNWATVQKLHALTQTR